ncbi:MAG: tetratricopeptide repeat protein [Methylococcales bacterium]|nr:tetratricopeptide repeat protein [Methylococcales bacterium]
MPGGIIYFDKGQKNTALEDFEKAVALKPENGKFYLSR